MPQRSYRLVWTVGLPLCSLLLAAACASMPVSPGPAQPAAPISALPMPDSPLPPGSADTTLAAPPSRQPTACPKLDSRLMQLVEAGDPLALAQQLKLPVQADRVQVVLVVQTEDIAFLEPLGVVVGGQAGQEVQAYVPISRLCTLAAHPEIAAIRLPDLLITP